ncbi:MAG: hypothetical protein J1E96_05960 [Ruminococcus sp.]|nr:hypothetical protein [Ruminococcus sp.]
MADFNDLFEAFPDYDVFTDSTTPPNRPHRRRPLPNRPAVQRPRPEAFEQRTSHTQRQNRGNDYGDGFGEYFERKTKLSNFTTLFFFPFIIIWLEAVLRLETGESFLSRGVVYTLLFTVPISCVLTLICTFAGERFNRVLANIFAAAITLLYLCQLVYFGASGALFAFSGNAAPLSFGQICSTAADKWFFLVLSIVPLLVSLLVGKRLFRFKRIRVKAKIMLVIIAAVFHLIAFGLVYTSQLIGSDSYTLYSNVTQPTVVQERFGLMTTQRIDVMETIK